MGEAYLQHSTCYVQVMQMCSILGHRDGISSHLKQSCFLEETFFSVLNFKVASSCRVNTQTEHVFLQEH